MSYRVKVVPRTDEYANGRSELVIYRNDKGIAFHTDGGEPEDNLFYRDWDWIAGALEQAYQFGLEDGKR